MFGKKFVLFIMVISLAIMAFMVAGCPEESTPPDEEEPDHDEVFQSNETDNTFIGDLAPEDTIEVGEMTVEGTVVTSGDTVETRLLNISGTVPSFARNRPGATMETETINLSATSGSCGSAIINPDSAYFTIDQNQTVSLSWNHSGLSCFGDDGYSITLQKDGVTIWIRDYAQGIGMDIDTTWGTFDLTPGTYRLFVNTYVGTSTNVTLTYTPGTGGVSSSVVVYHNGHLYPVSDGDPGDTYSYVVDLHRGNNVIRVLVIGNFDATAQQDLQNILGASDPFEIYCQTDEINIRAVLTWNIDVVDVDLHLIAPGGNAWTENDCYFSNKTPNWGDSASTLDDPALDVDNTDGYGPETIVLPSPVDGLYTIMVHYWSDDGLGPCNSTVMVTLNETTTRNFGPRNMVDEEYWFVTGINVSGGNATFTAAPDSASLFDPVRFRPTTK